MRDEIPEQWRDLFEKKKITSGCGLADAIGFAPEMARRLILGMAVECAIIEKAAQFFRVPEEEVQLLRGEEPAGRPFMLPREADRLTTKQRRVVRSGVVALLDTQPISDDVTELDSGRPEQNLLHPDAEMTACRRTKRLPPTRRQVVEGELDVAGEEPQDLGD